MTAVAHQRRALTAGLLVLLLAAAGWALWRSARPTPVLPDQRAAHLAASLRCPACEGQSVADSQSPVAAAMRQAVVDQVHAGRSDDEIRDWFVQRYGSDVLLDPSGHGIGLLLWLLPALVLLAGVAVVVRARRRTASGSGAAAVAAAVAVAVATTVPERAGADPRGARAVWVWSAAGVIALVGAVALTGAGAAGTGADPAGAAPTAAGSASPAAGSGVQGPVSAAVAAGQALEERGQFAAAAAVYQDAVNRSPQDALLYLHLGFALLRAGQPAAAENAVREVLAVAPAQPDALLVLGLAQRASKDPHATGTLRRFLQVAPDHVAAAQVRRLLAER